MWVGHPSDLLDVRQDWRGRGSTEGGDKVGGLACEPGQTE